MMVKYVKVPARRDRNGRIVKPETMMESMDGSLDECRAALVRSGFTAISHEAYLAEFPNSVRRIDGAELYRRDVPATKNMEARVVTAVIYLRESR